MTDIIDRLKEPEAHYPGNFDTPKRANAMLSCLCQEAMEEIESLRRELADARQEIADRETDCATGHDQDEATIADLRRKLKHMTYQYNAALEAEQVRYQQLCTFEAAVRHVTEDGKTKRSFSTSEGWAMVHKDRLTDLEIAEEQLAASQAREQQLREAYVLLENFAQSVGGSSSFWEDMNDKLEPASVIANFEKADTSALEAMIAKAGEVMRERFHSLLHSALFDSTLRRNLLNKGSTIPGVTLEDIK